MFIKALGNAFDTAVKLPLTISTLHTGMSRLSPTSGAAEQPRT